MNFVIISDDNVIEGVTGSDDNNLFIRIEGANNTLRNLTGTSLTRGIHLVTAQNNTISDFSFDNAGVYAFRLQATKSNVIENGTILNNVAEVFGLPEIPNRKNKESVIA